MNMRRSIIISVLSLLGSAHCMNAFVIRNCARTGLTYTCYENSCREGYPLHAVYAPVDRPADIKEVDIQPGRFVGEIMHKDATAYNLSFSGKPMFHPDSIKIAHNAALVVKTVPTLDGTKLRVAVYENTSYDTGGHTCCYRGDLESVTKIRDAMGLCVTWQPEKFWCAPHRVAGCNGPNVESRYLRILAATEEDPFTEYDAFLTLLTQNLASLQQRIEQRFDSDGEALEMFTKEIAPLEEKKKELMWYRDFMGLSFWDSDKKTQSLIHQIDALMNNIHAHIATLKSTVQQQDIVQLKTLAEQYPSIKRLNTLIEEQATAIKALNDQITIFKSVDAQKLLDEQHRLDMIKKSRQAQVAMDAASGLTSLLSGILKTLR